MTNKDNSPDKEKKYFTYGEMRKREKEEEEKQKREQNIFDRYKKIRIKIKATRNIMMRWSKRGGREKGFLLPFII